MTLLAFELVHDDLLNVETLMLGQADEDHSDLRAALHHLVKSGGKRIRPTLTLLYGDMLGGQPAALTTLAAAIEMLHTATLVHDDLIDGALLRRGMPTLNAKWSPAATVLTGDYLFARAAKLAAQADSLPAMHLFSDTLSVIVNGEITQLFSKGSPQTLNDRTAYITRINAKTASLFRTACMVAALVSPVSQTVVEAAGKYGYAAGMAFQMMDDILDFMGDESVLGKPVGSDLRQGLVTLPVFCYLENGGDRNELQAVLSSSSDGGRVDRFVETIKASGALQSALKEAGRYVADAQEALNDLADGRQKQALSQLADYIVDRKI